jgi:hypothetical protein
MKEHHNKKHKEITEWIGLYDILEKLTTSDIEMLYLLKQGQKEFEDNNSNGMITFWSKYAVEFGSDYFHKFNTGEIYRNDISPYAYHPKIKEIFRQKLREKHLLHYTHFIVPIRDYIFMRIYRNSISFD